MKLLKVGQRIKYRSLRGTVLRISLLPLKSKEYEVQLDNGAMCVGSIKQFKPVKRA